MRFEWNDKKALENVKKHGVTFVRRQKSFTIQTPLKRKTRNTRLTRRGFQLLDINPADLVRRFRRTASRRNKNHFSATADTKRKESV